MRKYSRIFAIGLALVLLTITASQTLQTTAGPTVALFVEMSLNARNALAFHTTSLAQSSAAEGAAGAAPEIREQTPRRAYTMVQTKRVVARLKLAAESTSTSNGSFQITISSTLPLQNLQNSISFSLQGGKEDRPKSLPSPTVQSGKVIVKGTIQPSAQEWVVDVDKLPTEPSTSVGLSMTSPVGRITGVTVDPVVQVDQTAYSVTVASTHPMTVTLMGYAARKVWPNTSADGCEGLTLTWQAAPDQSAAAPAITQVITQSSLGGVSGAENQCEAQGIVSLTGIVASGRYTYTLQAVYHTAYGDFSNQAQTVLEVIVPPTLTPTNTFTPTPCPTGQVKGQNGCATITPTPTNTFTPTNTPTPTSSLAPGTAEGEIVTAELNVRTGPSTAYPALEKSPGSTIQLRKGTTVVIVGKNRDWWQIRLGNGQLGWISGVVSSNGTPIYSKLLRGNAQDVPFVEAPPTPTPIPTKTPTPTITPTSLQSPYFRTSVKEVCSDDLSRVLFNGTVKVNGRPVNGYQVVFKSTKVPGDEPVTAPAITRPDGSYEHIVDGSVKVPAKSLQIWIIDNNGNRISDFAYWDTHGSTGNCNRAEVNFYTP